MKTYTKKPFKMEVQMSKDRTAGLHQLCINPENEELKADVGKYNITRPLASVESRITKFKMLRVQCELPIDPSQKVVNVKFSNAVANIPGIEISYIIHKIMEVMHRYYMHADKYVFIRHKKNKNPVIDAEYIKGYELAGFSEVVNGTASENTKLFMQIPFRGAK